MDIIGGTYMTMVSKIDDKGTFHRLNSDPSLSIISGSLETTHLILKQEGDGSWISVAFKSESEVRLGTFWVEVDYNFLIHVHTCVSQGICF